MNKNNQRNDLVTVLTVENNPESRSLIDQAFGASDPSGKVDFVQDGEKLLD